MSEADPVKALREWANLCENDERADYPDRALKATEKEWRSMLEASSTDDDSGMVHMFVTARALLAAAPDLLARLEAGEGLLREARARLFNAGLDFGHCAEDDPGRLVGLARGRALEARIDAFLAGKEAIRRDPPDLSCKGWNFHIFSLGASACSLCGKSRTEIEAAIGGTKREGVNRGN